MNSILTWVNIAMLFPVYPIMYFQFSAAARGKKGLYFNQKIPVSALDDREIQDIQDRFQQKLRLFAVFCAVASIATGFIPVTLLSIFVLVTLLLGYITGVYLLFGSAHGKLRRYLLENGYKKTRKEITTVDLRLAGGKQIPLQTAYFAVLTLLALVIGGYLYRIQPDMRTLLPIFVLLVPLGYWFARISLRLKRQAMYADANQSMVYARIHARWWQRYWMLFSFLQLLLLPLFLIEGSRWFVAGIILYGSVLIAGLLLMRYFANRDVEKKLGAAPVYRADDEDDYWKYGLLYYNPNSRKVFIEDRVGIGISLNMARKGARVFMGLFVLFLLVTTGWLGKEVVRDFSDFSLQSDTQKLWYEPARFDGPEIDLNEIRSLELLDELPQMRRTGGTSTDKMLTGRYRAGKENLLVYVNPKNPPFIRMETAKEVYLLGNKKGTGAESVYHAILSQLSVDE